MKEVPVVEFSYTLFGYLTYKWYIPLIRLMRSFNDGFAERLFVNLNENMRVDSRKYLKKRVIMKQVD